MTTSTFGDIVSRGLNWLLTGGARVILILGAIFLGLFLLRRALTKLQNFLEGSLPDTAKVKRARTLTHVLGDMVRLIIVAVGTLMVLSELGIDLTPLLMAAGVGGIAIGFGAQNLVKDIITGFLSCLKSNPRGRRGHDCRHDSFCGRRPFTNDEDARSFWKLSHYPQWVNR